MNPEQARRSLARTILATGVGSMPHADAAAAEALVWEKLAGDAPFWAQLPRRSFRENMYVQYGEQLPGLRVDDQAKSVWVDTEAQNYLEDFEACFTKIQEGQVDAFSISRDAALGLHLLAGRLEEEAWQGWVKAQVIGPVSLGLTLLDQNKTPILHNAELAQLLPSYLALKAAWLIRCLRAHAGTRIIVFIDEPYLVALGTSAYALPREAVIRMIDTVVATIHADGALAGIHCCGNTDWDLVMATKVDIVNFDAYGYFDKFLLYEKAVAGFLRRGGIPAVGIVPNTEALDDDGLEDTLGGILARHKDIFINGGLITASCGAAGLTEGRAARALDLSVSLARRMRSVL
ncbi:MAG: hypothetical protein ACM3L6_06340 [Deltaproteobacteria bacterium]